MKIALYMNQIQVQGEKLSNENLQLLEQAVNLKEQTAGELQVIFSGSAKQQALVRECLARGCDEAVFICQQEGRKDSLSAMVANRIKQQGIDVMMTGYRTLDGGTSYIGAQIAEYLDIPQISMVKTIKSDANGVEVVRSSETNQQVFYCKLPCVLTMANQSVEVKTMSVMNIIKACEKEIDTVYPKEGEMLGKADSPYTAFWTEPLKFQKKQGKIYHMIAHEDEHGNLMQQTISAHDAAAILIQELKRLDVVK